MLLFNLKKLIVNKKMEQLYFAEKHYAEIDKNTEKIQKNIEKLKEKKQTDKIIVEVSKKESGLQKTQNIQNAYQKFGLEIDYFEGLRKTIKTNFWK